MGDFPELEPGEVRLEPSDDLLLRNVHPDFYDKAVGRPSRQAFGPNTEDAGRMSVYQESQTAPVDAFVDYTVARGKRSIGVWAVTITEVESVGSRAVDDQEAGRIASNPLPPGHAFVDFRDLEGRRGPAERRAKSLRRLAEERGPRHFQPE